MSTAVSMFEFSSIAAGTAVADAMIKRAPVEVFRMGTVHPGRYLVLVGGTVAAVEESHAEGRLRAGQTLIEAILLPDVHRDVFESLRGTRRKNVGDALGVIETCSIPANIVAADRAIKSANVEIIEIRLGDDLGGKGVTFLTGRVEDVQEAVAAAVATVPDSNRVESVVIPAQHFEVRDRVERTGRFFG